jgi:hypothetical protein
MTVKSINRICLKIKIAYDEKPISIKHKKALPGGRIPGQG